MLHFLPDAGPHTTLSSQPALAVATSPETGEGQAHRIAGDTPLLSNDAAVTLTDPNRTQDFATLLQNLNGQSVETERSTAASSNPASPRLTSSLTSTVSPRFDGPERITSARSEPDHPIPARPVLTRLSPDLTLTASSAALQTQPLSTPTDPTQTGWPIDLWQMDDIRPDTLDSNKSVLTPIAETADLAVGELSAKVTKPTLIPIAERPSVAISETWPGILPETPPSSAPSALTSTSPIQPLAKDSLIPIAETPLVAGPRVTSDWVQPAYPPQKAEMTPIAEPLTWPGSDPALETRLPLGLMDPSDKIGKTALLPIAEPLDVAAWDVAAWAPPTDIVVPTTSSDHPLTPSDEILVASANDDITAPDIRPVMADISIPTNVRPGSIPSSPQYNVVVAPTQSDIFAAPQGQHLQSQNGTLATDVRVLPGALVTHELPTQWPLPQANLTANIASTVPTRATPPPDASASPAPIEGGRPVALPGLDVAPLPQATPAASAVPQPNVSRQDRSPEPVPTSNPSPLERPSRDVTPSSDSRFAVTERETRRPFEPAPVHSAPTTPTPPSATASGTTQPNMLPVSVPVPGVTPGPVSGLFAPTPAGSGVTIFTPTPTGLPDLPQTLVSATLSGQKAMIQIDPPEMGRIQIDYAFEANQRTRILLIPETEAARLALSDRMAALISLFDAHHGGTVDVEVTRTEQFNKDSVFDQAAGRHEQDGNPSPSQGQSQSGPSDTGPYGAQASHITDPDTRLDGRNGSRLHLRI